MSRIRAKDTKPEMIARPTAHRLGYRSAYIAGISPARPTWYSRVGGKQFSYMDAGGIVTTDDRGLTSEDNGRFLERQVPPQFAP